MEQSSNGASKEPCVVPERRKEIGDRGEGVAGWEDLAVGLFTLTGNAWISRHVLLLPPLRSTFDSLLSCSTSGYAGRRERSPF
jgi:hypothetical protein